MLLNGLYFAIDGWSRMTEFALFRLMYRTNGSVMFASGSPYQPVDFKGKLCEPGQGNNM